MLDEAREIFQSNPSTEAARFYTNQLLDYWRDGMIGPDTLRASLIEVASGLTEDRNDVGQQVEIKVVGR